MTVIEVHLAQGKYRIELVRKIEKYNLLMDIECNMMLVLILEITRSSMGGGKNKKYH